MLEGGPTSVGSIAPGGSVSWSGLAALADADARGCIAGEAAFAARRLRSLVRRRLPIELGSSSMRRARMRSPASSATCVATTMPVAMRVAAMFRSAAAISAAVLKRSDGSNASARIVTSARRANGEPAGNEGGATSSSRCRASTRAGSVSS